MADREQFSFSNLGVTSTEEIDGVQAGEFFLNSNPEDIKAVVKPAPQVEEEDDEEEEQKVDPKKAVKKDPKAKKEITTVEEPTKEIKDKQLYDVLEDKSEEEDDEDEDKPQSTEGGEGDAPEENAYNAIAQELLNHGIFTLEDDEEGIDLSSPEELLERFQYESKKQASFVIDKFLNRFGDNYRDMFENVFVKGINPVDYLNRYTKVEGIRDLDLADEANQEKVVRELYRSEGRSSEYIEKKVTQLKNYNDLLDEATEAQKILVDRQQKEINQAAATKQAELNRIQAIKNEYVNNVGRILSEKMKNKDFDGIPVDKRFAEETFAYATQERYQTPDGQLLTSFDRDILDLKRPENHELKVKVAMLLQLLKEDPTLSK